MSALVDINCADMVSCFCDERSYRNQSRLRPTTVEPVPSARRVVLRMTTISLGIRKMDRGKVHSSELHSSAFSIRRLLNLPEVASQEYDDQCDVTTRDSGDSHRIGNGKTLFENSQNDRSVAITKVKSEDEECQRDGMTRGPTNPDTVSGTIEFKGRIGYDAMPDSSSERAR